LLFKWKKSSVALGVVLTAYFVVSPLTVLAAEFTDRPNAGSALEGLKQKEVQLPQKKAENLQVEETLQPPLQSETGMKIRVNSFRFSGDIIFPEADLLKLVEESQGKDNSLADLQKLAEKITAYYQTQGYLVARAYVPAQRTENGTVEIAVQAGKYDKIILRNQTSIKEEAIRLELGAVRSGAYIEKKALERAIWLMGDLSGADAKATLAPGTQMGTSDLILTILPKGVRVSGNVSVDNYGNRFTGKNEVSVNATILNPVRRGDALSINTTTTGKGLNNGSVAYAFPAFIQGGRMEVLYSRMKYELGDIYASLDASGTADTLGFNYLYNIKRSRTANFYGQLGFMHKSLQDNVSGTITDKKNQIWTIGVSGDSLDSMGGGGANSYSAIYSTGRLRLGDQNAINNDALQTNGSYGKWNFSGARQQYVNDRLSWLLFWNAQVARKNLDSSEQMSLGGAYGVRAYPKGEASGDDGMLLVSELRWTIPMPEKKGMLQMVGFFDAGTVKINKTPITSDVNRRTLQGAGLGLVWNDPGKTMARIYYAWKVGSEVATSDTDENGRLWWQVTRYF